MQTFLPSSNFDESARCLDDRRLGKQRVEVLQILRAVSGRSRGWRNHPAVRMWRGHRSWLAAYGAAVCLEWRRRGFRDSCLAKILRFSSGRNPRPPWLGDERVHRSHRANLVRKDPERYGRLWPRVRPREGYFWPV